MLTISIINASTVLADADVAPAVAALQTQVTRDFAPEWGVDAELVFAPKGQQPDAGHSQLLILDTSDDASALGYHDLTPDGKPLGKSFAKSDIDSGASWTATLSHELLEMLADPDINLMAEVEQPDGSRLYVAYEVCDAVESDADGYDIDGVRVSDFVLPSYFESFHGPLAKYDFRNLLTGPAPTMWPEGYLSVFNLTQGWQQISADRVSAKQRPRVGSRRERRRTPRSQWVLSNPKG